MASQLQVPLIAVILVDSSWVHLKFNHKVSLQINQTKYFAVSALPAKESIGTKVERSGENQSVNQHRTQLFLSSLNLSVFWLNRKTVYHQIQIPTCSKTL